MEYSGLDPGMTVSAFQDLISEKCGVPAPSQELLSGYPQQILALPEDRGVATLASLGLASGETLVVRKGGVTSAGDRSSAEAALDGGAGPRPVASDSRGPGGDYVV